MCVCVCMCSHRMFHWIRSKKCLLNSLKSGCQMLSCCEKISLNCLTIDVFPFMNFIHLFFFDNENGVLKIYKSLINIFSIIFLSLPFYVYWCMYVCVYRYYELWCLFRMKNFQLLWINNSQRKSHHFMVSHLVVYKFPWIM